MPDRFQHFQLALEQRTEAGTLRTLKPRPTGIDFYSNDYLGLARNEELQNILLKKVMKQPGLLSGSTGSRLISGNSPEAEETEEYIATTHHYPSALLFPSGYNANLALFSTLPTRHDTLIVDEQIHRSVHDACRMSHARKLKFRHNDVGNLEEILKKQSGLCYIAIESLYSMEGDLAPIKEITAIADRYGAALIVDEAHALGVFGHGLVTEYQLQHQVLATVITYGKAFGAHGAAILSSELIKKYLINFASPFIYTTSAQDMQWTVIKASYDFIKNHPGLSVQLQENINVFRKQGLLSPSSENSPIQPIVIPDNERLRKTHQILLEKGMATYPIYSPTVKAGTERLRICLHSFNTEEEIVKLAEILKQ
ncbi:aminotransferase class I/II-fold pyridoxal phosphate-dependent enzyme [Chryseobacterium sp. SIMBA_029]|uniref:aminotransferase class I/II-fold pyridoxal phosphate-dependent enzyme n=1 Tax=Chryseobacterium sp. SIMBA_029 TaxID=3085772 RepID=UPI00397BA8F8